ncbi:gamma-glutamyl kinase [Lentibacter algarum]|uniref:sulfotransferase family 2 domain-containing protein n=1 Tax=Lentibacter algarum TaxID=576131 RepID=UPI001C0753EF|nr:sulfotransferase family 2 domain-containing protein [Lentibacter algarum]MBU2982182.1 gamma-glutamyl kinase [Lentibacter algarum]
MLIFSKAKLVLFSVPKTGTTAIETALSPLASIAITEPPELKHAPVYRYNRFFRPMVEKFIGEDVETIAVIREPVSWLGSWYRYRQRSFLDGKTTSTKGMSFNSFVEAYLHDEKPSFANVGAQSKFVEPRPNGTSIKRLFRYEHLDDCITYLEDRLGQKIDLPKKNVSPASELDLTTDIEARLRLECAAEFDLWNSIS